MRWIGLNKLEVAVYLNFNYFESQGVLERGERRPKVWWV